MLQNRVLQHHLLFFDKPKSIIRA